MEIEIIPEDYLCIKVTPGSNKNEVTGILNDPQRGKIYKIKIKAPAEKGKANKELITFLSQKLSLPKDNIQIISGAAEQLKLLRFKKT